ncbi:DUF58 domain-containing protein [Colwelliaceae bacterium 6441]
MVNYLKKNLKGFIKRRFEQWLSLRMPSQSRQELSQKNIFIVPSRFGFAYLFFILLLFVLGTNYQNNLIIMMSYLLSSLFITVMIFCFMNLSRLSISAKGQFDGYAEEVVFIPIKVFTPNTKQAVQFNFYQQPEKLVSCIDKSITLTLPVIFAHRGKYKIQRLVIASEYPFGLFYSWTKLQFDIDIIIYPKPLPCQVITPRSEMTELEYGVDSITNNRVKGDDFYELKPYKQGEPLSWVAWKKIPKDGVMMTKHYNAPHSPTIILVLHTMPSSSLEVKLRQLCYLVLHYHQANAEYGINLLEPEHSVTGNINEKLFIKPSCGEQHLKHCLLALSEYSAGGNSCEKG